MRLINWVLLQSIYQAKNFLNPKFKVIDVPRGEQLTNHLNKKTDVFQYVKPFGYLAKGSALLAYVRKSLWTTADIVQSLLLGSFLTDVSSFIREMHNAVSPINSSAGLLQLLLCMRFSPFPSCSTCIVSIYQVFSEDVNSPLKELHISIDLRQ